jgi:hypothetical protein
MNADEARNMTENALKNRLESELESTHKSISDYAKAGYFSGSMPIHKNLRKKVIKELRKQGFKVWHDYLAGFTLVMWK